MTSTDSPRAAALAQLRAAAPWALVGIVLILAFGAYLRFASSGPFGLDEWWHGVAGLTRGTAPYAVAVFFAEVGGSLGAAACTAIAAALLLAVKKPREAAAVASALILGTVFSEGIKSLVMRPRPWAPLYESHGSSFPSGHSMGAAALAVSLALVVAASDSFSAQLRRWAWAAAIAWAVLMMWSRTALHVHWLSDVICGGLLGACAAILARRFWFRKQLPPVA